MRLLKALKLGFLFKFLFTEGLITYSRGVINDYSAVTDGEQVREPQRQVWIDNQRRLDLAMRLLNEGRYNVFEFLVCSRRVTPNFGVLRPQPTHQPVHLPLPQPLPIEELPNNIQNEDFNSNY